MWKCHQCHHNYRLGVTRRCLEDGHYFCSGSTTIKSWRKPSNSQKARQHRACPSEFDYEGWKTIGRWRRGGPKHTGRAYTDPTIPGSNKVAVAEKQQECWNTCDYPSECRWGAKFGIHAPVDSVLPSNESNNSNNMPTLTAPIMINSINTLPEGILKPGDCSESIARKKDVKTNLWTALRASAERRKSAGERGGSPLSGFGERGEGEGEGGGEVGIVMRDGDGDVVMGSVDPALLNDASGEPSLSQSQSGSSSSSAVDSLKALVSRRRYRRVKSRSRMNGSADKRYAETGHVVMGNVEERMEDQVSLDDEDMMVEGFAPLCRVRSRGCSV